MIESLIAPPPATIAPPPTSITPPASSAVTEPVKTVAPIVFNTTIQNTAFQDKEIRVPVGSTVIWTNKDVVLHTVTANDKKFDSGRFGQGQSFKYVFTEKGIYSYFCIPHPLMVGKVIVE